MRRYYLEINVYDERPHLDFWSLSKDFKGKYFGRDWWQAPNKLIDYLNLDDQGYFQVLTLEKVMTRYNISGVLKINSNICGWVEI